MASQELSMFLAETIEELTARLEADVSGGGPYDQRVFDAMRYSLMAGGKRLRPVLTLLAALACGGTKDDAYPFAEALEMIHTYSLIHDDLPAMDDDDYRRGRLTNHKVFGEATAILAGDGLLTLAFEVMSRKLVQDPSPANAKAIAAVARAAGVRGMVSGQIADMEAENAEITPEQLAFIEAHKTGKLIQAALVSGGLSAGASDEELSALERAGEAIGIAFQIQDDILDVEGSFEELGKDLGSDRENQKATYVSLFGIEKAKQAVEEETQRALQELSRFQNLPGTLLRELLLSLVGRRK